MQEEFEKKVRERLHTFGIQPSHQVWDEIDAVLNKKKHRRVFAGWWILLGLAVIMGAVWFVEKDTITRDSINQQPPVPTDTIENNITQTQKQKKEQNDSPADVAALPVVENEGSGSTNTAGTTANADGGGMGKAVAKTNTSLAAAPAPAKAVTSAAFSFKAHVPGTGTTQAGSNNADKTNNNLKENSQITSGAVAQNTTSNSINPWPNTTVKEPPISLTNGRANTAGVPGVAADSSSAATGVKEAVPQTAASTTGASTAALNSKKGGQWFFSLSAGTTQTISYGAFSNSTLLASLSTGSVQYLNVPVITSLGLYGYQIEQPGTGFHFAAGGIYEKNITNRWKVSGGLKFAYLTNTQKTGSKQKSSFDVAATNNLFAGSVPTLSVDGYYEGGNTASVVNRAWQAEVPVNVGFVINPKSKIKFMLNGGVSFAWLFSSQWLIPDSRYSRLYYNKSVFNNTTFNWQAGPSVELPSHLRFGLQYQQSFNTLAKDYVTPKLYWQNISVYTAIPLGKKSKR